jgi:hypothetical protein
MTRTLFILIVVGLVIVPVASADRIHVSWLSQQYSQSSARVGARIDVRGNRPGRSAARSRPATADAIDVTRRPSSKTVGGATDATPRPVYPPLPASSPLLQKTQPSGPGSFWYWDSLGHICQYTPASSPSCFTVTGGGNSAAAAPPLTPESIAAHVADRMTLSPGQVRTSPTSAGLTGAASWFWLDPAPLTQQLSVSLAGESVTVTATPEIMWQFGDGSPVDGGAGVAYQPGPVPPAAITHVYDTRCLPGDQGRDPYVLSSCGSNGYQLVATVRWQISYRADGPIAATGALPSRTTTTSDAYPVSEARAFLVDGTAG